MSATQGNYTTAQLLLDITQGARVSYSAYTPGQPPPLSLTGAGIVKNWPQALKRANQAPQILQPGLLATAIPGGAAYAGSIGENHLDGVIAANRSGHLAAVSLGPAAGLPARIARLSRRYSLVVADLPPGSAGEAQLRKLAARRPPNQLLLLVQRAPDRAGYELLWSSLAGFGGTHPHLLHHQPAWSHRSHRPRPDHLAPPRLTHSGRHARRARAQRWLL